MKLEIPIRKQISLFSMMVALVLFFTGCQGGEENGTASVRLSLNLSSSKTGAAKTASAPAPTGITSIQIDVTGPEMAPFSDSFEVNSEAETVINLEIAAGPARRFVVTAFDTEQVERFRGETTADLEPGTSPAIRIVMVAIDVEVPILPIEITPTPVILTRSIPGDPGEPQIQSFTMTNATFSQVDLSINGRTPTEVPELGQITSGENPNEFIYIAPEAIPIDRTQTQIGVPIPITIEAVDNPNRRAQASVKLVTGPQLSFEPNVPVSLRPGFISTDSSGQRSIAYHNGKVYAVWVNCPDGCLEILFSETSDGIQWSEPRTIARDRDLADPSLAVSPDGSIYVTYVVCSFCSSPSPTIQLIVRPFGETDFKPIPLSMIGASPRYPTVAVAPSGIVFVAWSDVDPDTTTGRGDIYLQRVPIDTEPRPINTDRGDYDHTRPAISVSNTGEVFVAWEVFGFIDDNSFHNIAATASTDGGATFLPPAPVNDPTQNLNGANFSPTVATGPQGTVYVAWEFDSCGDDCELLVYFAKGTLSTNGLVFSQNHPFGNLEGPDQDSPSIAWDGANGIYVAFREQLTGGDQIRLAKSVNDGNSFAFSQINSATSTFVRRLSPSLAVDSAGRSFSIWTDGSRGQNQLFDVFFAKGE